MLTSLKWLSDYLPGAALDAAAAGDALMRGGLPVENFQQKEDDTVLDVEVTSNRSDCLSHVGVARGVAALMKPQFAQQNPMVTEVTTPASSVTSVRIDAPNLC